MKMLVLGASGMAGHTIALYFQEKGHEVDTVASRNKLHAGTVLIDIKNTKSLDEELVKQSYDVVINCVGLLVKESDACKSNATLLNSYLPNHLAEYFSKSTTKIIHISTDAVFSGKNKQYDEDSPYDGQSFYGRSKALGEINNNKDLTIRTSIIGPELGGRGKSFFDWFYTQNGDINGFTNVIWNGVTTIELAKFIDTAIKNNVCGIYNLASEKGLSKFDLLILLKDIFNKNNINVQPVSGSGYNSNLVSTRNDFSFITANYTDMMKDMKSWMHKHQGLYSKYL